MTVASRRAAVRTGRSLILGALVALGGLTFAASASAAGFVIGDGNATVGSSVTFWGAQWWKDNSLSGGSAPPAFKGFANTPEGAPTCGTTWSTDPGNSSEPPAELLPEFTEFIEVIVSSEITKSGATISGNTTKVVLVKPDPGYAPDPGHAGTGTVEAVLCPRGIPG